MSESFIGLLRARPVAARRITGAAEKQGMIQFEWRGTSTLGGRN